jgi:hypothetical protein
MEHGVSKESLFTPTLTLPHQGAPIKGGGEFQEVLPHRVCLWEKGEEIENHFVGSKCRRYIIDDSA